MIEFIPSVLVFSVEIYLLILWVQSRRNQDGKDGMICLYGFLIGQIYILWETILVSKTGPPPPGSAEKNMFMARFVLGGFLGGIFTIMGLFYLSGLFSKK